ncbi:MAG TPA: hypothetical protein VI959_03110 [Alphaproteobacteria bacterium]|nr:hypothetical protein [Alphaproteobacteria bacterium]
MAKKASTSTNFCLPNWLNIETIEPLLTYAKECIKQKSKVELIGNHVERVGMPGVQALLVIKKECTTKSLDFDLKDPSDVLKEAFNTLGCSSYLS